MKTYSIGRDLNCDIVINDSTDVISRRHALLSIAPSGKMTIIDQSSNGTYVNGIRITQNVPVPVTRKDIVSLAHVAKLDWRQVPKSNQWIKYVIGTVVAAVVILGIILCVKHPKIDSGSNGEVSPMAIEKVDSTAIKQKDVARLDSIKNVERQDSIKKVLEKVRQDSINQDSTEVLKDVIQYRRRAKNTKKEDNSKVNKDKSSQSKKRTIG